VGLTTPSPATAGTVSITLTMRPLSRPPLTVHGGPGQEGKIHAPLKNERA